MDTDTPTTDRSISTWKAQVGGVLLMVPVALLCTAPHQIIWGDGALDGVFDGIHAGVLVGVFIGGIVAHELLHGIGWALAGGQQWQAVSFGFKLKTLTPYAHVDAAIEAWAYRVGTALPGVALGLVPWGISLGIGSAPLHLFGVVFTASAVGDAMALWLLRGVPGEAQVQDHPDRVGCLVADADTTPPSTDRPYNL